MKLFLMILIASVTFGKFVTVAHAATVDPNAAIEAEYSSDLPETYGQAIHNAMNGDIKPGAVDASVTANAPLIPAANVSTDAELQSVVAQVNSDPHFSEADSTENAVHVVSKGNAKLFGLFPVPVEVETSVDANGNATVKFPWYDFLLTHDDTSVAQNALDAKIQAAAQVPNPSGTLSVNDQAIILTTLEANLPNYFTAAATTDASTTTQ